MIAVSYILFMHSREVSPVAPNLISNFPAALFFTLAHKAEFFMLNGAIYWFIWQDLWPPYKLIVYRASTNFCRNYNLGLAFSRLSVEISFVISF